MRVYLALGDAAHFGMPMFKPKLRIVAAQYPDNWIAPPGPQPTPIQPIEEEEEEYVSVLVPRKSRAHI